MAEPEIEEIEEIAPEIAEEIICSKPEKLEKTNKKFFTLEFSVLDNTDSAMEIEIKIINHMNKKIVVTNQIISQKNIE